MYRTCFIIQFYHVFWYINFNTPPPFFQVQCISKIQHASKKKIASWTIMPITIKVNSEMVLFDKIFINYWCKHYINNQISPNIHTVLIHQTISTIFMMQKKYSLCIIICTQQKILLFRPKGAYGVPLQYERSFRWKLGQFRYLCTSNALPGHVKITVSRDNLFEDSFQQVMIHFIFSSIKSDVLFIHFLNLKYWSYAVKF